MKSIYGPIWEDIKKNCKPDDFDSYRVFDFSHDARPLNSIKNGIVKAKEADTDKDQNLRLSFVIDGKAKTLKVRLGTIAKSRKSFIC